MSQQTVTQESVMQETVSQETLMQELVTQTEGMLSQEALYQQHLASQQQKQKIIVPPMHYRLEKLSHEEALFQIASLTNGFADLPPQIAHWINWDICSRRFTSFGYIPAPPNVDMVKQIIGIDGYYFKLTTTKCGVDFIWHDRATNEFHFWGEFSRCIKAMNEIRYRICKVVESYKNKPVEHVFDNDIHPNAAVCFEAAFEADEKGNYVRTIASKHYPADYQDPEEEISR